MVLIIGILGYIFFVCIAVSALGGSQGDPLLVLVAVGCVLGAFFTLYNAKAIVGLEIAISFGGI